MKFLWMLFLSFVLYLFMGCSTTSNAVRLSYSGEPSVKSSRSSQTQKSKPKKTKTSKTKTVSSSSSKQKKVSKTPQSISRIESKASKYIGVRYKYGGTTSKGLDCSGFVWRVYQDMGYDFTRTSSKVYYKGGSKISENRARKGDLVFFKKGAKINHVGIYLGEGKFIHSSSSRGVIKSELANSYWKPRVAGFRRYF